MNKNEIVSRAARATGASREDVAATMDAVLEVIAGAVGTGEVVRIARFGKFEMREIPERKGHNPRTGQTMRVPAYRRIAFTPFAELRTARAGD